MGFGERLSANSGLFHREFSCAPSYTEKKLRHAAIRRQASGASPWIIYNKLSCQPCYKYTFINSETVFTKNQYQFPEDGLLNQSETCRRINQQINNTVETSWYWFYANKNSCIQNRAVSNRRLSLKRTYKFHTKDIKIRHWNRTHYDSNNKHLKTINQLVLIIIIFTYCSLGSRNWSFTL
jgi:hypothetical protein